MEDKAREHAIESAKAAKEFSEQVVPTGKYSGVKVKGLDDSTLLTLLRSLRMSGEYPAFLTGLTNHLNARRVDTSERDGDEPLSVLGLEWLLHQQGYKCALSGLNLTPDSIGIDHIIPKSDGGLHVLRNVQLVDKRLNIMKSRLDNDEFIMLCQSVADTSRNKKDPC